MRSPNAISAPSLPYSCVSCVFGFLCLRLRVHFNREFILCVVRCSHLFAATATTATAVFISIFVSVSFTSGGTTWGSSDLE